MSKHTPGPWKTDAEFGHESVIDAKGVTVADCAIFYRTRTVVVNQANARLIAAAPDLYEALKELLEHVEMWMGQHPDTVDKAQWAIAKAEGRS